MPSQDSGSAPLFHTLTVDDLVLQVSLGCLEEERQIPQDVRISLEFRFIETPPEGFYSDRLSDTLCYAEICEAVSQHIQKKSYHLIEKIAADTYSIAKAFAQGKALVALRVHKVNPPVPNLRGGTTYRCGDF